ncbi:recombination mediator RecR [Candidatus Parcubacteria bacterium]|nr:recombination mediator RecR [Candidatus Parcubacteria bacterium]
MNPKFKSIAKLLQKFPGVGPRQAARFVLALLDKPESELQELGLAIQNLKREISFCPQCFNVSDNGLCGVCHDPLRDKTKLLVIEKVTDLDSIEKTGLYKGLYHVLGGAINPLDGITPQHLHLRELASRINALTTDSTVELIIATNPNTQGETTALYLRDQFDNQPSLTITRLGRGLASGSHLEYADELTVKHALDYRK